MSVSLSLSLSGVRWCVRACVCVLVCVRAAAAAAAAGGRVCGCPRAGAERGPVSHELPFPQSDLVSFLSRHCGLSLVCVSLFVSFFLSFLRQQVDLDHMPRNSLATYCEMLITHRLLSETLGPPSKVCSTVPSPNNNSRPPLRDS